MVKTLLLLLASVGAGAGTPPPECAVLEAHGASNVWERAKVPELAQYCDLLAAASAKLASSAHIPTDVIELVEQAEQTLPGKPAPRVLLGRALARLGRYKEAVEAFEGARERDPLALEEPVALLVWARVLAYTGRTDDAMAAYRKLLPRAGVLMLADRGVAYVGAGMTAMSLGPRTIEDAVSILREGRKNSEDVVQHVDALALALALDRAGQRAESRIVLAESPHEDAAKLLADPAAVFAMGAAADVERTALMALALEDVDPASARSAWGAYLEGPGGSGPWAEHAAKRAGRGKGERKAR